MESKAELRVRYVERPREVDTTLDEYLNLDYEMSIDTTNESIEPVDFKKPETVVRRNKNKEKPITLRKPRTRSQTNWMDSDHSDDC
jgi:hypothetical protein